MSECYSFVVNGVPCSTEEEKPLLRYLRDELRLTSVKDGCSEGACGTCTILVDGKAAAPRKMFDTFLAVDISEGTHRISFSYEPEGLGTGAWITGVSAAVLGVTVLVGISRKKKKDRAVSGYSIRKNSKENKKSQKKENSSKQESSGK